MKILKSIIIVFCFSGVLYAQEKNADIISFHFGPNFSNFINSEAPQKKEYYETDIINNTHSDFGFGLEYEVGLNRNYSLLFGAKYETKGIDLLYEQGTYYPIDNENPYGDLVDLYTSNYYEKVEIGVKNKYLTFPIGIKRYFNGDKFYVKGSAFFSYLLNSEGYYISHSQEIYYTDFYSEEYSILERDDKDKNFTNYFDYGFLVGTGLNLPLNERLFFIVDYNLSLSLRKLDKMYDNDVYYHHGHSIFKPLFNYYGLNSNSKNISMALHIGVGFNI